MTTRKAPIFCTGSGKTVKETKDKEATGNDDVLKLLGDGLKIITQLINNIYETGESCPRI
jgi:hypothetical protein